MIMVRVTFFTVTPFTVTPVTLFTVDVDAAETVVVTAGPARSLRGFRDWAQPHAKLAPTRSAADAPSTILGTRDVIGTIMNRAGGGWGVATTDPVSRMS